MSETRRETLKILGAIGATCAFPFPADELYGQHVQPKDAKPAAARPQARMRRGRGGWGQLMGGLTGRSRARIRGR